VTRRERVVLAATILAALVAGGVAGAGVGLHWYSPPVGVGVAVLIGLAVGAFVLRTAIRVRRARREASHA
jgi:F0F1-type ATP synthase assembly protein I